MQQGPHDRQFTAGEWPQPSPTLSMSTGSVVFGILGHVQRRSLPNPALTWLLTFNCISQLSPVVHIANHLPEIISVGTSQRYPITKADAQ